MADDLSLLFRIRADAAGVKPATAEARAEIQRLKATVGGEFNQMQGLAKTALADIGSNLQSFAGHHIPLVGGVFHQVTSGLQSLNEEFKKGGPQTAALARQIDSIAKASGKSNTEVSQFLSTFSRLKDSATKNEAAFKTFGGSVDLVGNKTAKFLPELEQASTQMAAVAEESAGAGAAIAGMAGPVGIAVIAIGSLIAIAAVAAKEIFELTKSAAEFEGKMFDLAQQTGLSVETLSALEVASRTTGGELGSITQAVVLFQRKLDDAQDPLSKTAEQFRKFKITTSDTETALRGAFKALAAMPEGFAQTNAATEFFGARGGKQVLAILKETNGDLDTLIARLREMGILISEDSARAADKFNDELALLEFQLRAAGAAAAEELIPAFIDVIKASTDLVRALNPLLHLFSSIAGPVIRSVGEGLKGLSIIVATATHDWEALAKAIKEAKEAEEIPSVAVPPLAPVPLPGAPSPQQTASEAVNNAEAVLAAVKRSVAAQNQTLASLFQQGRLNREQEVLDTIASNKRILEADRDRIDALITQKAQEAKALEQAANDRGEIFNRDTDQYRAITATVTKLQQERLDKENEFDVTSKALRAKAATERANSTRNQFRNESDLLINEFDRQIKEFEAKIKRGATPEESGLAIIEQLEQAKIDERIESVKKQKEVGFLTVQDQKDLDAELQKLNQERDRLQDEQAARRLQRERDASQRSIEIAKANIDALLQLEQIAGQRRIDSLNALAAARVLSEEEAARQVLAIRLQLIDDEIEATKTKLTAAGSIADKSERLRTEADLNNQIKILTEERKSIQADGNREIEAKRQEDLANERRYAEELQDIKDRIADIERDTADEVIRLMRLHFARRSDIIRAQRDLDLADEEARHQRVTESIRRQIGEVDQQIRILEVHIKALKIGTTAEIEQYERIIDELEKLRAKRDELKRQQDAEDERSKTRKRRVTDSADKDAKEASPLGRLDLDTESLKEFASVLEGSIVPLGEILKNTFLQVSDAIGQTVSNWVLLGETGPAVMRKILAQALASLAAEAAVNAIKELALGFATLFFNPAESAAHFTSAALWGAIGGVAAVAGRGIAGGLFKPKNAPGGGASSDSRAPGQLNPITLGRNQPLQQVQVIRHEHVLQVQSNDSHIVNVVGSNIRNAGQLREIILNDGGV